jgi:hypothetical protein
MLVFFYIIIVVFKAIMCIFVALIISMSSFYSMLFFSLFI